MSKILRKAQKIFGISSGIDEISQFGSLANSTPNFTLDPTVIQALTQYADGWFEAVIGDNSPAMEDMNALHYLFAYQLAYIMQEGVPEWDATTTYFIGSIVSDGTGQCYVSTTDNNIGNAVTDGIHWRNFGGFTTNVNAVNIVVPSGQTYSQPNPTIPIGTTWTVNSGGNLTCIGPLTVNGTLITNGTSRIV